MTTDQPYPEALPRCQKQDQSAGGTIYVCALPDHPRTPNAHHFIKAEVHWPTCNVTKTTSSGIVFRCSLKRHVDDPDAHFFDQQVGTVPVRRKHHLSLYLGGME